MKILDFILKIKPITVQSNHFGRGEYIFSSRNIHLDPVYHFI